MVKLSDRIIDYLLKHGTCSFNDLKNEFKVSESDLEVTLNLMLIKDMIKIDEG